MNTEIGTLDDTEALFRYTSGPRSAKIILIGEAWGFEEASAQRPFVGAAGKALDCILDDAGLSRNDILCTNLIHQRAEWKNGSYDLTPFLYPQKEKTLDVVNLFGIRARPVLARSLCDLIRLIDVVAPKLIIVAGNWPLWALAEPGVVGLSTSAGYRIPSGIAKWRGSQLYTRCLSSEARRNGEDSTRYVSSPSQRTIPLLPIIHPAAILREWGFRQITVNDLRRATRFLSEKESPTMGGQAQQLSKPPINPRGGTIGWDPPNSTYQLFRPTYEQVIQRLHLWKLRADEHRGLCPPIEEGAGGQRDTFLELAVDLETWRRKYISVIGLADSKLELCIPLFTVSDGRVTNLFTITQEQYIFAELKTLLEHPNVRIIGQNFIYDTEWLHRYYNIRAIVSFDTMVAHHLLFPGTPKRLDYLASLYLDHFIYWKDESSDWDGDELGSESMWKYNCKDTRATYDIAQILKQVLATQPGMEELYAFQMEQWKLSRSLMLNGTNFDIPLQKAMKLELLEEANQLSEWLLKVVPTSWQYTSTGKPWFDSPKGTAEILYTVLGLNPQYHKKTGNLTTDDTALQKLSEDPKNQWLKPFFDRLRHLRSIGVFISHFLEARTSPDGRIRCSFNIAHPETFRWSSNSNGFGEGTNLQNIPKGEE